ncbi:signal recognition particle protein [Pelagibacteraceae bacterium]|jgi:signal recognition particle subunit SRP54|nr:signal recognition particle protein [Pelagibacteraceae bacterium]MDC3233446.1 signal recognition particle protein [Pelagibacteraceae bacterium]
MFNNLTNKLENIFSKLKSAPSLSEEQVDSGLKEIRQALIEADVALPVAKEFIANVKPKAIGQEIIRSTSPGQMIVKIVYDELVNILGAKNEELNLKAVPPVSILLVGLQGSGKTTSAAKLAKLIEKNFKKKVMLVSLDVYRPAAQEQLRLLAEQNNILNLPIVEKQQPIDITKRALNAANLNGSDVIIFDTAGRTQLDLPMMSEIKQVKKIINPVETILVADSLTGQIAVNVAKEFDIAVSLSSIILTRVDGDGRGGAALSMKYVTGKPIKYIGVGEKIGDFELFHPDRIANRIIGMGDVVSLVEKASQDIDEEKIKKTEEELKKGVFTMDTYLSQLRQMKKMGGMEGVMSLLPGVNKMKTQMDNASIDEKMLIENEAVILSMTKKEKENPKIISGSRRKRISQGAGVDVSKINKLLKQFKMMSDMMKKMSQGKKIPSGVMPDEIINQLK